MNAYLLFMHAENTSLGIKTKKNIQSQFGAISINLTGLTNVSRGDTLFIVGHGSAVKMTLAGHSPANLAEILTDNGLSQPVNIFLYSCNAGFGGGPYALELKMELVQKKILCSVIAPTGKINSNFKVKTTKKPTYATGFIPSFNKPSWVH